MPTTLTTESESRSLRLTAARVAEGGRPPCGNPVAAAPPALIHRSWFSYVRFHLPCLPEPATPATARKVGRALRTAAARCRRRRGGTGSAAPRRGARGLCAAGDRSQTGGFAGPAPAPWPAARAGALGRHHGGAGPAHPGQAGRCGRGLPHVGRSGGARPPGAHGGGGGEA